MKFCLGHIVLLIFFMVGSFLGFGQQDVVFSQYTMNQLTINPSQAGTVNGVESNLVYRSQWTGLGSENIETQSYSIHGPVNFNRFGVGAKLLNERISGFRKSVVQGVLSYKINLAGGFLSYGMEIGFQSLKFDWEKFNIKDEIDPSILELESTTIFDFGSGLYFQKESYYIGISGSRLNRGQSTNGSYTGSRHYYLQYGYKYRINSQFFGTVSGYLKYLNPEVKQVDLSLHFFLRDKAWLGMSLRTTGDLVLMAGINLKGLTRKIVNPLSIGYAYEVVNRKTAVLAPNSHEILVSYTFLPRPNLARLIKKKPVASPAFFE